MIAIITINDYKNIGNRLQNYAMFKILSSFDETYNLIRYLDCEHKKEEEIKKEEGRVWFRNIVKFFIPGKNHYSALRHFAFVRFNKLIKNGETLSAETDYSQLNSRYDYFVTGSDQVWNPSFKGNGMYINMLAFTSSQKKIAGCPSISIDTISLEQEKEFCNYLSDYKYLSCREKAGSEYISKITGNTCITLIDPTLVLSQDEWDEISKKPIVPLPDQYIMVYFLGNLTDEYNSRIQLLAQDKKLHIVNVNDKNSKYYGIGPAEFIYMIKRCNAIVTDSYHGTIFSLIYNKPVRVFKRVDETRMMNSRFDSLVQMLDVEMGIFNSDTMDLDENTRAKYSVEKLAKEKAAFINYFNSVFAN